jgi:hypothetical protein
MHTILQVGLQYPKKDAYRLLLQHFCYIGVTKAVQCLLQNPYVFCPVDQPLGPDAFMSLLSISVRQSHLVACCVAVGAGLAEAFSDES